ncbi:MAG: hypothetical protein WCG98_06875 [bacterium]
MTTLGFGQIFYFFYDVLVDECPDFVFLLFVDVSEDATIYGM